MRHPQVDDELLTWPTPHSHGIERRHDARGIRLKEAIIDSTVEQAETIAERYEDLATLGLELDLDFGAGS